MGTALIKRNDDKYKKENTVLERVMMDPSGYHAILCSDTGDNFCISYRENKIKYL